MSALSFSSQTLRWSLPQREVWGQDRARNHGLGRLPLQGIQFYISRVFYLRVGHTQVWQLLDNENMTRRVKSTKVQSNGVWANFRGKCGSWSGVCVCVCVCACVLVWHLTTSSHITQTEEPFTSAPPTARGERIRYLQVKGEEDPDPLSSLDLLEGG